MFLEESLKEKNIQKVEVLKDPLNVIKERVEIDVVFILEKSRLALTFRQISNRSRFSETEVKRALEASSLIRKTSIGKAKSFFNLRKCPFGENPRTFLYYLEDDDLKNWVRRNSHLV